MRQRPDFSRARTIIFALGFLSCLELGTQDFYSSATDTSKLAKTLMDAMTDEQVVAQTFMIGYTGAEPPDLVFRWITERGLGGIKIFGWNTEDLSLLVKSVRNMQKASAGSKLKIPLFVATDQEGGWIRHIKGETSQTPGNMAIGASDIPDDAFRTGEFIGRELAVLGINMNFAPTVDIATNPDSRVIGSRAFSDDPMTTALLGTAFFKGMEKTGVICTAKHFPGHGDTALDSHGTLPSIRIDFETAWNRELVPYRMLAKEGIPAVMSGHLSYPLITGNNRPASLSPVFLQDILRGKIGFGGLVITDDLCMNGAVLSTGSTAGSTLLALRSGNDVVMFSRTPETGEEVWTAVLDAYRKDASFKATIRASVTRILRTKLDYLRRKDGVTMFPDPSTAPASVPAKDADSFFLAQACRSATWIKKGSLPLDPRKAGRVLLAGQFTDFFAAAAPFFPEAEKLRLSYLPWDDPESRDTESLLAAANRNDVIIIAIPTPAARKSLDALAKAGKKVYAISLLSPRAMQGESVSSGSLAVYSYSPFSFRAAFLALTGAIEPKGILPVALR